MAPKSATTGTSGNIVELQEEDLGLEAGGRVNSPRNVQLKYVKFKQGL